MRGRNVALLPMTLGCTPKPEPAPQPEVAKAQAPLMWAPSPVLVAGDTAAGDRFGSAVLLGDDLAFVGARGGGAVYTFSWSAMGWVAEDKLVPSDAGPGFGRDLSRDGERLLIGYDTGAYVFDRIGGVWTEQAKLTIPSPCESISVFGDVVFLGAPTEIESFWVNGAAYVFENSAGAWSQVQKIIGSTSTSTRLGGDALLLGDDSALVGAMGYDTQGAVIEYQRIAGVWTEQSVLLDPDPSYGFGSSLAVDGDTLMVGRGKWNNGAHVFVRNAGAWAHQASIEPSGLNLFADFGYDVALRGDTAIIGSPKLQLDVITEVGAAYIYTRQGGTWSEQGMLLREPPKDGDAFGHAVAIRDDMVIVGAPDAETDGLLGSGGVTTFLLVGAACTSADSCGSKNCVDGVCCDSTCGDPCESCDQTGSEGVCTERPHGHTASLCGNYVCDGQQSVCPDSCLYDGDCTEGYYCPSGPVAGDCVPKHDLGEVCQTERDCASGICVDGVCCDSPCNESCGSCTLEGSAGICSPVQQGQASDCEPYLCDGRNLRCPELCVDDSACPSGFACSPTSGECTDGPLCDGDHTIVTPGEPAFDCAPYRCDAQHRCRSECNTSADCVDGFLCHADGRCRRPEVAKTVDGCACTTPPRGTGSHTWLVMVLLAALARLRRRGVAAHERDRCFCDACRNVPRVRRVEPCKWIEQA